jgi:predicted nucleic-acid-binding Zn-ribbon protein
MREEAVLQEPSGVWSLKNNMVVTFICGKCGFMELYHRGKTMHKWPGMMCKRLGCVDKRKAPQRV